MTQYLLLRFLSKPLSPGERVGGVCGGEGHGRAAEPQG